MKEFKVKFEAWEVTEPTAGGIKNGHLAYFASEADAKKLVAETAAIEWCPRYVNKVTINKRWVVLDSISEYEDYITKVKKQIALNKLTAEERKLLGYE